MTGLEIQRPDVTKRMVEASMTKSMHAAQADLKLDRLLIVHPGRHSYPVEANAQAVSIRELRAVLASL